MPSNFSLVRRIGLFVWLAVELDGVAGSSAAGTGCLPKDQ